MDLVLVGQFIRDLRKEKGDTQEELAEKFYVSRRTVSRWETGANLPDIDILIELADYFNVDLREILNGKRKDNMKEDLKETAINVNEYNKEKFKRTKIITLVHLVLGILALTAAMILLTIELPDTFWFGFLKGALLGTAFAAILIAILYVTGIFDKYAKAMNRLFHKS